MGIGRGRKARIPSVGRRRTGFDKLRAGPRGRGDHGDVSTLSGQCVQVFACCVQFLARCVNFSAECVHFGGGGVQFRPTRGLAVWSPARGGASSLRSEDLCWPSRDSQATGADSSVQGEPGPGMAGAGNDINASNAISACVAGIAGRGVVRLGPPGTASRLTRNGGGLSLARTTAADASLTSAMIPYEEYNSPMSWEAECTDEFGEWWRRQDGQ